jgi:hypothetical protein
MYIAREKAVTGLRLDGNVLLIHQTIEFSGFRIRGFFTCTRNEIYYSKKIDIFANPNSVEWDLGESVGRPRNKVAPGLILQPNSKVKTRIGFHAELAYFLIFRPLAYFWITAKMIFDIIT